jgi:hypothetical protein
MIDRKFEPVVKRLMAKYLGELEDDDMVMFIIEHLKDHKGPLKLVEGLEPVRAVCSPSSCSQSLTPSYRQVLDAEAMELTISIWRQLVFESMAYDNGLVTERMLVD